MLSKEEGNLLLDFYGSLLTEHQLSVLNDYFVEDLSMNEIADEMNISKAAVSDIINRSVKQLESYEAKLNLIKQDNELDIIINELNNGDDYAKKIATRLLEIYRGVRNVKSNRSKFWKFFFKVPVIPDAGRESADIRSG